MDILTYRPGQKFLGWIPKTKNYTKCKRPIPKGYILYDSIKFYKKTLQRFCTFLDLTSAYSDKKNECVFLSAAWVY